MNTLVLIMTKVRVQFYVVFMCFISFHGLCQTYSVPKPSKKEWQEDKFYKYWSHEFEKSIKAIKDKDETWEWKAKLHNWNMFIAMYNLWPQNPEHLYMSFNDALTYEPNSFCEMYTQNFRRFLSYLDNSIIHYKSQIPKMDCICEKTLSYEEEMLNVVDRIYSRDQKYRGEKVMEPNDPDWFHQNALDSINLVEIDHLIDSVGYLGRNQVGSDNEDVIWLVILHSNLDYMKKYLPLIKDQIDLKNLTAKSYAYIFDRICMLENRPQVYGTQSIWQEDTQTYQVYDILEEEEVNKRRYMYQLTNLKNHPKYEPEIDGK